MEPAIKGNKVSLVKKGIDPAVLRFPVRAVRKFHRGKAQTTANLSGSIVLK